MWLAFLVACVPVHHPQVPAEIAASQAPALADFGMTGPIGHEMVVSARWRVPRSGILDLSDPAAAALSDGPHPILLPVHVLAHPRAGVFVVDTGVTDELASGGSAPARGLVRGFLGDVEPVEGLGAILARQDAPLAGVLFTHLHLDHILGLPDVPRGTPLFSGPGELDGHSLQNAATRATYSAAFEGHDPLRVWDFDADGVAVGEHLRGIDVLGDGSLWVIQVPGHTSGSVAVLARTVDGPKMFVGDTSHTRWGWDHAVPPGTYTEDAAQNRASLVALRALAEAIEGVEVFVGHEA